MAQDGFAEGRQGVARIEAFSDGVLAIIITIMVLELNAPEEEGFPALLQLWPVFFAYVLSYAYIAIYWAIITACSATPVVSPTRWCGPISPCCSLCR